MYLYGYTPICTCVVSNSYCLAHVYVNPIRRRPFGVFRIRCLATEAFAAEASFAPLCFKPRSFNSFFKCETFIFLYRLVRYAVSLPSLSNLRFINGINCFGGFETTNAIICTVFPKPISSAKIPPTIFFGFLDVDEAVMLL